MDLFTYKDGTVVPRDSSPPDSLIPQDVDPKTDDDHDIALTYTLEEMMQRDSEPFSKKKKQYNEYRDHSSADDHLGTHNTIKQDSEASDNESPYIPGKPGIAVLAGDDTSTIIFEVKISKDNAVSVYLSVVAKQKGMLMVNIPEFSTYMPSSPVHE
jgi:hypothetical protein